jgi:TolA-binding protein
MRCGRSWQAAARDDGRLSEADVASFERHATTCPECQREASLAASIARAVPVPYSPLEHQRARGRLLRQANEELTMRRRPGVYIGLSVAAAAAIVLFVRPHPHVRAPVPVATPEPARTAAPAVAASPEPASAVSSVAIVTPPPPRPHLAPAVSAGTAFDDAFATFERGAYGVADVKFERFIHAFPGDPRTEDAAYLRAVARSRMGDKEGAAELARTYLELYPHGFRRIEAQRLAQ